MLSASAELLNSADRCSRLPYLSQRWKTPAIRPIESLYQAVEAGLTDPGNTPWDAAEQVFYDLATFRGLDSAQTDLLGEAEHLASLASFIVYLLRPQGPWKRPEDLPLPNGSFWHPGSFLDPSETHLRRLVLCSRWDAYRQVEEEYDWRTLEGSIYGVAMDLVVVVIGSEREGRRHGLLTKGWTHPVSKQLRFRKRDGSGFDGNWNQIWREKSDFGKEAWLDALVQDDVLPEVVRIHSADIPNRDWCSVALPKLARIREAKEPPEESPSMCFNRIHPCPFRRCCPNGIEPSPEMGFVPITSCP